MWYLEGASKGVEEDRKEKQHATTVEAGRVIFQVVEHAPFVGSAENCMMRVGHGVVTNDECHDTVRNNPRDGDARIASQSLKASFNAKHHLLICRESVRR